MTMRPWKTRDIEGYLNWLDGAVEMVGGTLSPPGHLEQDDYFSDCGQLIAAVVKQEVRFPDGTRLAFTIVVGHEGNVEEYYYQYMDKAGQLIGRLCHKGAHAHLGDMATHVHYPSRQGREVQEPAGWFEFDDAVLHLREALGRKSA